MSEADPEKGARKATRRHRTLCLTTGLPLAALLVVPWHRYGWLFVWEVPDEPKVPLLVAGLAGLLFVGAAFVAAERRRAALALAGLVAGAAGVWGLGRLPFSSSDLRAVGLFAARAWLVLAMWTAGAEMAMHRRPESRAITVATFLGWLGILAAFFFVPIGPELSAEGTAAAELLRKFDDRWHRMPFVAPIFGWFAFVALLGFLQTLRRIGPDREVAAGRLFRRSWLAWGLYPAPLIALFGLAGTMAFDSGHEEELTNVALAFGLVYGCSLGGALAVRSVLVREGGARFAIPKRGLIAVGAVLAIAFAAFGLQQAFDSAGDEGAIEDLGWEVAEAVGQALRGEPFDRRFLGGYSELDLRNAEGVVDLPEGAAPAVVLFDVSLGHLGPKTLLLRPGAPPAWVTRTGAVRNRELSGPVESLEAADPAFAAMATQLEGLGCLPSLENGALEDPALAAAFVLPPSTERVCGDSATHDDAPQVATLAGPGRVDRYRNGAVDRYVVVFAAEGSDPVAVTGLVHAASGRPWIGNPTRLVPQ